MDPAMVDANIRAEDYLPIGRYALQFLWSDAHYTGIYPFHDSAEDVPVWGVRGVSRLSLCQSIGVSSSESRARHGFLLPKE